MENIINPITGEILDENNIDSLLRFIDESENILSKLMEARSWVRYVLLEKAHFEPGTNTARINGNLLNCKIEKSTKINWNQKGLDEILCKYPYIAANIIKIGNYKVDMREYKKILNNVYEDELMNNFKNELVSCNLGIAGHPRITIENKNGSNNVV